MGLEKFVELDVFVSLCNHFYTICIKLCVVQTRNVTVLSRHTVCACTELSDYAYGQFVQRILENLNFPIDYFQNLNFPINPSMFYGCLKSKMGNDNNNYVTGSNLIFT